MTGHIRDIPQVVGKPAGYVNDATGTQHVVYRGDADYNVINEVRWDGTGLHYTNLNLAAGGTPAGVATGRGDPAAYVFRAQGTEHVVYRGYDNHVHELRKDASGWHHGDLTAGRVPQGERPAAADTGEGGKRRARSDYLQEYSRTGCGTRPEICSGQIWVARDAA